MASANVLNSPSLGLLGKSEKKHRLKSRFEVIRKLGQGTYGKVQLAICKDTGQEVALKTIKKSKIETEKDLIRIRREIQIMSSIQHPNIIHIYDVFENASKIVLAMQFARGGELYEYVNERKKLTDNEARKIFRQISTAIYYCHKNKVCHRDIKLENILLDDKGNAKIGDFGLSNVFDLRNTLATFCGSPLYASPEIVKGTPYYGPEVDCWSLGVLLYTLVYGVMPFDGSSYKNLVKLISEAKYFEPKIKSDASNLIRKLLCVQPSKRATIIDICTDAWVNKDCERCLLQVAEDLANLTPVKIEILLALAPIPQSESQTSIDNEKKNAPLNPNNKITVLEPNDEQNLKRRKSSKKSADSKKSKDKENDSTKTKKSKDDNQDDNKKSIKSSQQQSKNSLNQDSDYVSEEPISLSKKSDSEKGSRSTINQSITELNDTNKQNKNEINSIVTRKPSVKSSINKISNNVASSKIDDKSKKLIDEQAKDSVITASSVTAKINKPEVKEEQNSTSSISLVRKPSTKTKTVSKTTSSSQAPSSALINKDSIKDTSKDKEKEINNKEISKDASKELNKEISIKDSKDKKILSAQPSIEILKESQGDDQNKDQNSVTPIRTTSKIGDAKRMFEKPRRQESIEREKQERIILLNKVSDVKNKFERRASVNAANASAWNKPSSNDLDKLKKKASLTDASNTINLINNSEQISNKLIGVKSNANNEQQPNNDTKDALKEINKTLNKEAPTVENIDKIKKEKTIKDKIEPIETTTSISTIKSKLIGRQISESSSSNNPPTGNDRSNLKIRRHTVKAKTSNSTATVPTIAELKRKSDLFSIKEKSTTNQMSPITEQHAKPIETIKENEVSNQPLPPLSPTKTSSLNSSNSSVSKNTITEQQITSPIKSMSSTPLTNITTQTVRSIPPTPLTNITPQTVRSPTPTNMQNNNNDIQNLSQSSLNEKPKLKIISNTSSSQTPSKLLNNQSSTFIVQSPSVKSTNSQDSFSGSTLNLSNSGKLAPITRSYKKISFTKDGQAITETGRIISELSPTGTKITKKIITKKSETPTSDGYEPRINQSFDSETDEYTNRMNSRIKSRANKINNNSISSNTSTSTLRKSDSTSSSESVDIFDMDFDNWIGDSMFNNISSKFKSLFNQNPNSLFNRKSNPPFPSFLNKGSKSSLAKRAESCERKYNDENQLNSMPTNSIPLRRAGYSTEGESDTDNEENGQNVGLWKFLNPNITTRFLNKHPSLMNGMDFFNDDLNNQNRSRERLKFDSKPPTILSNRFKSASRDLNESNEPIFKTTFTIRPNSSTSVLTTSRNNSGSNLVLNSNHNNQNMHIPNSMTSSTPSPNRFERMNSDNQMYEFEPNMKIDFKSNFPITLGRIRSQNPQLNQSLNPESIPGTPQFNTPRHSFNRSISSRPSSATNNSRSFMEAGNYRGLNMGRVHEIPIEIVQDGTPVTNSNNNSNNMNNNKKEFFIPITRQTNNLQFEEENNSNSLLDQLKTHGYRNLVNQRTKLMNNIMQQQPQQSNNEEEQNRNGPIINKNINKRGKSLENEFMHVLTNNKYDNDDTGNVMFKSMPANTQEIDLNTLNDGYSIKSECNSTKNHKSVSNISDLNNLDNCNNNLKSNHLSNRTNQFIKKEFDYKGLMNVARELNCLNLNRAKLCNKLHLEKNNSLTKKYSVLSTKSLEHLNRINLTTTNSTIQTKKPYLFNIYSPSSISSEKTNENNKDDEKKADKNTSEKDVFLKSSKSNEKDSYCVKNQLNDNLPNSTKLINRFKTNQNSENKQENNYSKSILNTKRQNKSGTLNDNEDDIESTNLDESITPSSTSSLFNQEPQLYSSNFSSYNKSIDDLKDDYLNCSINNQVDQIQQLIRLLYSENDSVENDKSVNKKNNFKEDNYQLLRKTQSDLKELKNDLQILQLKNKLKRRLTDNRNMCNKNRNNLNGLNYSSNENRDYSDTSGTNTITATSDDDDDENLSYRKKSSYQSLPPLPPIPQPTRLSSLSNNNSSNSNNNLDHKLINRLNERLMNDNLIKSNKRTFANELMDVNCLTKSNLTSQSKFNETPLQLYQKTTNNDSNCISNKKHGVMSNLLSNCNQKSTINHSKQTFPSSRSSSSLNGQQHQEQFSTTKLNGHRRKNSTSDSLNNLLNDKNNSLNSSLHTTLNKTDSNDKLINGTTSELQRRSTIGSSSSKETMQERILRKSYYTRFNSPDRTSLDNHQSTTSRMRRKSALTDYLDNVDYYLNEKRRPSQRSKSITRSIMNLDSEDDSINLVNKDKLTNLNARRTSHSPYRTSNNIDTNDDNDYLSDDDLLKSLSSVNRRNSFAYGSSANRYPSSLQASFERNLSTTNDNLNDEFSKKDKLNNLNGYKRNSIAHYDSNNNLFKNNLNPLRLKLNESNGQSLLNISLGNKNLLKNDLSSNQHLNRARKSIEIST